MDTNDMWNDEDRPAIRCFPDCDQELCIESGCAHIKETDKWFIRCPGKYFCKSLKHCFIFCTCQKNDCKTFSECIGCPYLLCMWGLCCAGGIINAFGSLACCITGCSLKCCGGKCDCGGINEVTPTDTNESDNGEVVIITAAPTNANESDCGAVITTESTKANESDCGEVNETTTINANDSDCGGVTETNTTNANESDCGEMNETTTINTNKSDYGGVTQTTTINANESDCGRVTETNRSD